MDVLFPQEPWNSILRILAAGVLGALVGLERDIHGRAAGLRTHLLVSAGAAIFTILSSRVAVFGVVAVPEFARVTDPGRIAAQIVTGIGFLGAGTIIKEGFTIRGLTTAASLWITAAIGMASGAGFYAIAAAATIFSLFSLIVLHHLEKSYRKHIYRNLTIALPNDVDITQIIHFLRTMKLRIMSSDFNRDYVTQTTTLKISMDLLQREAIDDISATIVQSLEKRGLHLKSITWSQA